MPVVERAPLDQVMLTNYSATDKWFTVLDCENKQSEMREAKIFFSAAFLSLVTF